MSCITDYTNSYDIRGQRIIVTVPARFDRNTGKVITDLKLDGHATKLALEKYQKEFGIISPTNLKNLRHHWNFSKEKSAEALGWNMATIAFYEAGAMPSISDNRLLEVLVKGPKSMEKFTEDNEKEELQKGSVSIATQIPSYQYILFSLNK